MNLKKNGKIFTSKFVSYRALVIWKKNLLVRGLTKVEKHCITPLSTWELQVFTTIKYLHIHNTIYYFMYVATCLYLFQLYQRLKLKN